MSNCTVPRVGDLAPDFEYVPGNRLSGLKSHTVLLAFFPPGWDPSREHQIAAFNQILANVPNGGRLLGITSDRGWCEIEVEGGGLRFPLLQDLPQEVARLYGVSGESAVFVVDGEGIIRWSHVGPAPSLEEIAKALKRGLSRRELLVAAMAASLAMALLPKLSFAAPSPDRAQPNRTITLNVNGKDYRVAVEPRVTLLDALRERIGLTGTKKGCDHGQCGACTVHVNGRRMNSCLMLAMQAEGEKITTVEGLARGEELHPVQAAFITHDGFQCGYCTPGQIMSAVACIQEGHAGSDDEIRTWMSGNICRCGAYNGIVDAIKAAKGKVR